MNTEQNPSTDNTDKTDETDDTVHQSTTPEENTDNTTILSKARALLPGDTNTTDENNDTQHITTSGKVTDDVSELQKDFIAPQRAIYHRDEAELDGGYVRTYYINAWPQTARVNFLNEIFSTPNLDVDVSIHTDPQDPEKAKSELEDIWGELEIQQQDDEENMTLKARDTARAADQAKQMYDLVSQGKKLFDVSMYITVRADTKDELNDLDANIHSALERDADTDPRIASRVQDKALRSSAPLAFDDLNKKTAMFGDVLGNMFPFSSTSILEAGGINMGLNARDGSPVIVDPFNRKNGYNRLTLGKIGSGKSFSEKQKLIRQALTDPETNVTIIDPMGGFAGVNQAMQGDRIVVDGNESINPMEIEATPQHIIDQTEGGFDPYKNKMEDVRWFFDRFVQMRDTELEKHHRGALERAIKLSYREKGITQNPETHTNDSPTIQDVLSELADIAENPKEHAASDSDVESDTWSEAAADLLLALEPFREGNEYDNLSQPTDISLGDNDVTYIDLSQVSARGNSTGLMMQLLFSQVYQEAKQNQKKNIVVIDEAHKILKDSTNLTFLEEVFRHSRHFNMSIDLITQTLDEFFISDASKAIADQCSMVQYHRIDGMNRDVAKEYMGLNDNQINFIEQAEPGEGDQDYSEALLDVRDVGKIPLRIFATQDEVAVIDYKPGETTAEDFNQRTSRRIFWALEEAFKADSPQQSPDWYSDDELVTAAKNTVNNPSNDGDSPTASEPEANMCDATNKSDEPCSIPTPDGEKYCHIHQPDDEQ